MAAAIAVVALAVPAGSAATTDLRNPDSKASAIEAQLDAQGYVDLRSPDSRNAAAASQSPSTPVISQERSGFDWGDASIGAGSALGLLLIMLSVAFGVVHRRGRGVEGPGGPAVTT